MKDCTPTHEGYSETYGVLTDCLPHTGMGILGFLILGALLIVLGYILHRTSKKLDG